MTLTAITGENVIVDPSLALESGADRFDLMEAMRRLKEEVGLYCPHCLGKTGKLNVVKYRNSESRRVHFYHPTQKHTDGGCINYSSMTEKHLIAQYAVSKALELDGWETKIELVIKDGETTKPDVLAVNADGVKIAHEIQIQPISLDGPRGIVARSKRHLNNGLDGVAWYLYGKSWNIVNRQFCSRINEAACYRLRFSGDGAIPVWSPCDGNFEEEKTRVSKADKCDRICRPMNSADRLVELKVSKAANCDLSWRHWQSESELEIGVKVTGVPGRASHGWHGQIERIERIQGQNYYLVLWQERKKHKETLVSKQPILGHCADQLALQS